MDLFGGILNSRLTKSSCKVWYGWVMDKTTIWGVKSRSIYVLSCIYRLVSRLSSDLRAWRYFSTCTEYYKVFYFIENLVFFGEFMCDPLAFVYQLLFLKALYSLVFCSCGRLDHPELPKKILFLYFSRKKEKTHPFCFSRETFVCVCGYSLDIVPWIDKFIK